MMITAGSCLCGKISVIIDPEVYCMRAKLFTISAIIFALAMFRLLPHLPNVSPVAAMALFGGAYFADKRMALIIPFLALFLLSLIHI